MMGARLICESLKDAPGRVVRGKEVGEKSPGMKTLSGQRDRRPTIIDVAREAAVAIMTVSRVINNHPSVRPATRAKVMKAIARVGYVQNDAARMLKGQPDRTIGLIVPDLTDFFAHCFQAVQQVAMAHGYQTVVVATGRNASIENEQLDAMGNRRIAGIVIVTSGADAMRVRRLVDRGTPVVALDRPFTGVPVDVVLVENREGAELGVAHLIEHGHKRIGCVGFGSGSFTHRERLEAYRSTMVAAGLAPMPFETIRSVEDAEGLLRRWVGLKDAPTAVFSMKRIASIHLVQALNRLRIRVPQDLAVVGFDDFELAEALRTPLTVVQQPSAEIARAAAELLFRKIAGGAQQEAERSQPVKMVFPARLVIRQSCGCMSP